MSETEDYAKVADPTPHGPSHEKDGADEVSIANLSGETADEQNAGKIKGVEIDDSEKADQAVFVFDEATDTIKYVDPAIL